MSARPTRVTVTSATMFAVPSSTSSPSDDFLEHEDKSNNVSAKDKKHSAGVIPIPQPRERNLALRSGGSAAGGGLEVMRKKESEQDSSLRSE